MNFSAAYNREDFLKFLNDFLPEFKKDIRPLSQYNQTEIKNSFSLGRSEDLDIQIFEFSYKGSSRKRVQLTKEAFQAMKQVGVFYAIAAFYSEESDDWRLSLMTASPAKIENGKITTAYSNPRRYSFFLGPHAKINTPTKYLLKKEKVTNFGELKNRFSVEVVNKEFYNEISKKFTELVSGQLKLPSTQDKSQKNLEFAVRLIGRVIFCWFLREKRSAADISLMPKELLSLEAIGKNQNYYHKVLEPIFFEILNKPIKSRREDFSKEPYSSIPYLNGGLFSPQEDDYYKRMNGDLQSEFHNTLTISDEWFKKFFETLETYNFTIDENTSYDEELSIDPEMLGRIFENLLAEINPETGESARKSTGSYYTPRSIVNYMVDESLLLYLKEQTGIDEEKLRAVISYDLNDDVENKTTVGEKEKIINALEKVKILDPACGSGAFPIGALQKIVFILQQTDPEGQLWFRRQISNTPPEVRRVVEREFEHKNFDYIRKLGIIRENIYGIDIQPIATEISRLRCFLTLVVDERIDDSLENRGIQPLPNLDFKFVTANSLIGLPKNSNPGQVAMFDNQEKIDELKQVRDQYFTASGIEREQLKSEFSNLQKNMIFQLVQEHGLMSLFKAELTKKLAEWDPFSHKTASWFDPEWMFGVRDGFDIIIANPPYGANIDLFIPYFRKVYIDVIKNYADIFKIFYQFGIQQLKENGILAYISPNVYLTQPRYKDLRKYLVKFCIHKIINLGLEVFEGAVVPTAIIFIQNKIPGEKYQMIDASVNSKYKGDLNHIESTEQSLRHVIEMPDFSLFQTDLLKEDELILDKVMVLKDAGVQYHRSGIGLKNKGGNDLFQRLVSSDQNYFQKCIPIWYGKLLSSYYISPTTNEYFNLDFKDVLKSNESVSYSKEAFNHKEKILWRQTAAFIVGTYDDSLKWFRNTIQCGWLRDEYVNKINIKYILALLNSKYLRYKYQRVVNESAGRVFPQVKLTHVKKIPIKIIDIDAQKKFIIIVDEIIETFKKNPKENVNDKLEKINRMVYELYGLTEDEIKVVEENIK